MARSKKAKKRQPIANSKLFWVLLLTLVSFSFAFPVTRILNPDPVYGTVFGDEVTRSEIQSLTDHLERVGRVIRFADPYGIDLAREVLGSPATAAALQNPWHFLAFRREADHVGIRVSDAELADFRRRIWRALRADELARDEIAGSNVDPREQTFRMFTRRSELLDQLNANKVFDRNDWGRRIRDLTGMPSLTFEESLRDILAITKLGNFVTSSVVVTDKEVWEHFEKQDQERKGAWVPLEPTPELEQKIRASFTDDDLRQHLELNRDQFRRGLAIGAEYLIVPSEHFRDEAAAAITDEDLRRQYEASKSSYRRPGIPVDTGYELLSAEEMEAREKESYLPFEDVEDQVREKVIADRRVQATREFANRLSERLSPRSPSGEPTTGASFEEVAREYPFLEKGTVEPTPRTEMEKGFGAAYSSTVNSWFTTAEADGDLSETQRQRLGSPVPLPDEKGFVFYRGVRIADPRVPELDEIRDEVAASLYRERISGMLEDAARAMIDEAKDGSVDLAALEGTTLDVKIGEEGTAPARFGTVKTTPSYVGRTGEIRLPAEGDDAAEDETETKEAEAKKADEEKGELHPASSAIVAALFAVENTGGAAVARAPEEPEVYVVSFRDRVLPDASKFTDARRSTLRGQLEREQKQKVFFEWFQDIRQRALPPEALASAPIDVGPLD